MRAVRPLLVAWSRSAARFLPAPLSAPLQAARQELHRSLHLAFSLATLHRRAVCVAPALDARQGGQAMHLPLRLPDGVQWGRPDSVPLPPDLLDSGWRTGQPRPLTILPDRRAASNVWFLHHGREALCLRLGLVGQVEILRYRPLLGAWLRG